MNLNNPKLYKKLDTGQVAKSISLLPDQIRQVLEDSRLIKIPAGYTQSTPTLAKKITQVVINGMGGSNLGARIIKSLFSDQLKTPVIIQPGYEVPAFVNKNTLYIISSYSGNTEEPLSAYDKAKKQGAKILAITEDGAKNKLKNLMLKDNIPGYIFKPKYNPSNQPRLGLGYSIFGTMSLLAKAGVIKIKNDEIKNLIAKSEINDRKLRPGVKNNPAKIITQNLFQKQIIVVGAEFLSGNVHTLRNQISENSKNFTSYLTLPELNHYAMEGLANPQTNKKDLIFLFFDSRLYHPRIQKRSRLTQEVIKKNKIQAVSYELKGKTKLEQSFEMLQLGVWITYYLGMLNEVDPAKIPWVDWFKKQLG